MNKKKVKAVIFDWAGTTVDFGCFAPLNVFVEIFKEKGIEITIEEARKPMGMLKKDHVRAIISGKRVSSLWKEKFGVDFTENDVEELYSKFEPSLISTLISYTDILDGVVETCEYLREKGIKIGSTTGYTKEMINIVQKEAVKKGYSPDTLVTAEDASGFGRPYPYMIFKNMEMLQVYPAKLVVKVGDTISDIEEGVNAGTWSVGVIDSSSIMGLSKTEFDCLNKDEKKKKRREVKRAFIEAGADFVIKNMSELPLVIEKINHKLNK